jgi:hypothetical protein
VLARGEIGVEHDTGGMKVGNGSTAWTSLPYTTAPVETRVSNLEKAIRSINVVSGTAYTLVLGDAGRLIEMSNAAANAVTVPPNSTVAFPIGTAIDIVQTGAGVTTITPGAGVTINYYSPTSAATRTIKAQWAGATLIKRATNTWVLIGNLT